MAGTRTVSGSNVTYDFKWVGPTARLDAIGDGAAHWLWDHGYGDHGTAEVPVAYASLTVTQKLAILDAHLAQVLTDAATAYKSQSDQDAARIAADAYATSNYGL